MSDYKKALLEERNRANQAAREIVDRALEEKRNLTGEEREAIARADAEFDAKNAMLDELRKFDDREAEVRMVIADAPEAKPEVRTNHGDDDATALRRLAKGEIRSYEFRDTLKTSTGAPVPTDFFGRVVELARATGPMLSIGTQLQTEGGASIQVPRTNAYPTADLAAEAGAYNDSDPSFLSFITLGAFKATVLFQVSDELLADNGVDLEGYFAKAIGQAIGYKANNWLTLGTGTVQPTGIVSASVVGGTTAGTAVIATNDVIDLVYSLDQAVRTMPGFGLMGSTSATAALRKLQDGAGYYIWQPSFQVGQPDRVLGYSYTENVHMAAVAAGSKSLLAGDMDSFFVRTAGGIEVATSSDYAFANGLVTYRASLRVDSNTPQTSHIKHLLSLS